ncbi:hypothetical protein [Promicromonospora iranensis]|uniref:hypothetical protein n=1 Tax=Promicromonospora iranensis TaxID=1105144 RepID=UPI0023AA182A|nr:hypothetical protein [Promicromonospora iranensis]
MPKMRVELPAADRAAAQKILRRYADGGCDRSCDDAALDEIWRLGHTPAGRPECVGITNGSPTYLKFDIEVHPGVSH